MNCNVCGKEFNNKEMNLHRAEDGTEYYLCNHCENEGITISEATEYVICKECGYPHKKDEFKGICKFCEQAEEFENISLTSVEEELLDANPAKLYAEKIGEEAAEKIVKWKESDEKEKVAVRHKRDRQIDTAFVVGIILGYILLELDIRKYIADKYMFLLLLIPTILIIITAPLFKKADRKPRKKPLPIWSIYVIMALLTDAYLIITKIFA